MSVGVRGQLVGVRSLQLESWGWSLVVRQVLFYLLSYLTSPRGFCLVGLVFLRYCYRHMSFYGLEIIQLFLILFMIKLC